MSNIPCPGCGAAVPLPEDLIEQGGDLAKLRGEFTRLLRKVSRLENERRQELEEQPESKELRAIFNYWREQTGHTRAKWDPAGVRAEKIRARLRVFTVEDLRKAIRGAAAFPFVVDGKRVAEVKRGDPEDFRYDDLKTVFKDEEIVGRMMTLADRVGARLTRQPTGPGDWRVRLMRRFGLLSEYEEDAERKLGTCPRCGSVVRIADVFECYLGCSPEEIDRALIELDAQDAQLRITEAAA